MFKLARTHTEVLEAIRLLNSEIKNYPDLASRLGQAHAYYVAEEEIDKPMFGFSKFVGYSKMTPKQYLENYKALNGLNTEHALSEWFEEIKLNSPHYNLMYAKLSDWLDQFGKKPRRGLNQQVRLMVLKPNLRENQRYATTDDDALLALLIKVAERLPLKQRLQLREAL